MKAVQVREPHHLAVVNIDSPAIQNATDVLVEVKRAGICGSDMHIYHGTNPLATYPRILGHEIAGEVLEVGTDVTHLQPGDHIVVEPIRFCGTCYACRKGRPNVCKELSVFGVHEDGGMREFFVLPAKQLHKVDNNLPWEEVVLAEPYTIGAQAVWRGNVQPGDFVFIHGSGPIGICILKLAKLAGATVMISDIKKERLAFAEENGADYIVHAGDENVLEKLLDVTNGEGANVVIDAVCLPFTVEQSVQMASVAGTIVILGFDERHSQIPQLPITKKELTIVGSRLQTNQFAKVVQLLNEGKLRSNGLITHRFSVDQAQEAFTFVENNPDKVRKALIEFT